LFLRPQDQERIKSRVSNKESEEKLPQELKRKWLDENNNDSEVEDINPEKANRNKKLMVKSNQEQALDKELTRDKLIQVFSLFKLIGFNLLTYFYNNSTKISRSKEKMLTK
jgi:hypothetical protein